MSMSLLSQNPERLIGLSPSDPLVQDTLAIDGLEQDEGICWYSCHPQIGVETDFRGESEDRSTLDTLFLYVSDDAAQDASDSDEFLVFSAPLPYGIEKGCTENDIIDLFGSPEWTREEIQNEVAGFLPRAFSYEIAPGKKLKVEFKNNSLYRLILHKERE